MKTVLLFFIKLYRKYISPLKSPCCRFYPTCSTYAIEAISEWGAIRGSFLTAWRILRCNPLCRGGIDEVPKRAPSRKMTAERIYYRGRNEGPQTEGPSNDLPTRERKEANGDTTVAREK